MSYPFSKQVDFSLLSGELYNQFRALPWILVKKAFYYDLVGPDGKLTTLFEEMKFDWIEDNIEGYWCIPLPSVESFHYGDICFSREEDAVLYKLTWL